MDISLVGTKVVMLTESKYDDFPRRVGFEMLKAFLYMPYRGAIVGGPPAIEYLRFLGFLHPPRAAGLRYGQRGT